MTEPARERAASTADALLSAAVDRGYRVTGDLRVSERDAERLLAYRRGALRQMRERGTAPPFYKLGGRVWFRLADLGRWIEERRDA